MAALAVWIATAGGAGYVPYAPGTAGAAVGVLLALVLVLASGSLVFGLVLYLSVTGAVSALGVWASGVAEQHFGQHDDGRIVVDEVAGQLVTLLPVAAIFLVPNPNFFHLGLWLVTGFVTFRVLDIWKPGPIGWAERRFSGGFGVMVDDLVAGMLGALLLLPVLALEAS